jgi:hypothetical protein
MTYVYYKASSSVRANDEQVSSTCVCSFFVVAAQSLEAATLVCAVLQSIANMSLAADTENTLAVTENYHIRLLKHTQRKTCTNANEQLQSL